MLPGVCLAPGGSRMPYERRSRGALGIGGLLLAGLLAARPAAPPADRQYARASTRAYTACWHGANSLGSAVAGRFFTARAASAGPRRSSSSATTDGRRTERSVARALHGVQARFARGRKRAATRNGARPVAHLRAGVPDDADVPHVAAAMSPRTPTSIREPALEFHTTLTAERSVLREQGTWGSRIRICGASIGSARPSCWGYVDGYRHDRRGRRQRRRLHRTRTWRQHVDEPRRNRGQRHRRRNKNASSTTSAAGLQPGRRGSDDEPFPRHQSRETVGRGGEQPALASVGLAWGRRSWPCAAARPGRPHERPRGLPRLPAENGAT